MERSQNQFPGLSVHCFKKNGLEERDEYVSRAAEPELKPSEIHDDTGLNHRIGRLLSMLDK